MKIGLLDIDGHNFPNLALMKISAYHKKLGHRVEFATMFEHYDLLYKSKVFSFSADNEYCYNADHIIEGGTGYKNYDKKLINEIEHICPDYSLYNSEKAYGFLTRGCIRKCPWCVVPVKEGNIKIHADIDEFISDKKNAILMDNNVLAHEHGIKQIEKISQMNIKIDFNQGIDARLINDSIAKLLSKIKWLRFIRLSCDSLSNLPIIENAIKKIGKYTKREIFVYMLIEKSKINDSIQIARILKNYKNVSPFAQPFLDVNLDKKNISAKQRDVCRWINIKSIFKIIDFDEYRPNVRN